MRPAADRFSPGTDRDRGPGEWLSADANPGQTSISPAERQMFVARAKALIDQRQRWTQHFGVYGRLFGDPCWTILLDLYVQPRGQGLPVTSVAVAAAMPATSALRLLLVLAEHGLIFRTPHPHDRRVSLVALTPHGEGLIERCLAES